MKPVLITSSILILLLAALRPLLRGRIDPRVQYALWLIIALRLLVPVEPATSAYSALALLDSAERPAQVAQAIGQAHVPIPAQSYDSAYVQVIREYEENGVDTTRLSDRELEQVDAQARERSQGSTLAQLFEKYARPLWLGGAVVFAGKPAAAAKAEDGGAGGGGPLCPAPGVRVGRPPLSLPVRDIPARHLCHPPRRPRPGPPAPRAGS